MKIRRKVLGSACCGGPPADAPPDVPDDPRAAVRDAYGRVAEGKARAAGSCCGPTDPSAALAAIGYGLEDAADIPANANLGLGCGNPVAFADLTPGEIVLDLGSGAGIDCFLAAKRVGAKGRAIGVDMTPSMLERARRTAAEVGASNVEFRLGEIEHLPVADGSVDAILSNCVVNLSPDKPQVFREALRVLRPGGRLLVSDLVLVKDLDEAVRKDVALYVGCIAGAARREDYLRMIAEAGFHDVEVLSEGAYTVGAEGLSDESPARRAFEAVVSLTVRARKPAAA